MSNDLNQCNFIGRLGADPETRYTQSGKAVTNLRIACGWKTKDNEGAEWISIVTWEKLAEICGKYLKKGSRVFVSGRMQTRKWQDKDGGDRYSTEIVADKMQMLDGKQTDGGQKEEPRPAAPVGGEAARRSSVPPGTGESFDDDVPF